jgi:hypothetical protein
MRLGVVDGGRRTSHNVLLLAFLLCACDRVLDTFHGLANWLRSWWSKSEPREDLVHDLVQGHVAEMDRQQG